MAMAKRKNKKQNNKKVAKGKNKNATNNNSKGDINQQLKQILLEKLISKIK